MRVVGISSALAVVVGLSPLAAQAAEVVFSCVSARGIREYITIDLERRKVVTDESRMPCRMTVQDGAYSNVFSSIGTGYCALYLMNGQDPAHQIVHVNGSLVTFGATNADGSTILTLDMNTGIERDTADGTVLNECHRAHS